MRIFQDEIKKIVLATVLLASGQAFGQVASGEISRLGETTHLEFSGLSNWSYDLQKQNDTEISITLPKFDEKTETSLRTWSDLHVAKIDIDKNGPDQKYIVKISLTNKNIESFDYLTDDPSRLIIDFYTQAEPKKPAPIVSKDSKDIATKLPEKKLAQGDYKKVKKTKKSKNLTSAKSKKSEYQKLDRAPAGGELLEAGLTIPEGESQSTNEEDKYPHRGIFDGNDPNYDRFAIKDYQIKEEAIIASQQNIYLKFPILKLPFTRFETLLKDKPEYEIIEKDTPQNKEARLLLSLYQSNRFGAFKKVYDYFMGKYPESPYDEILRNINADLHAEKYLRDGDRIDLDKFRAELKYLDQKYQSSTLRQRNHLLLAYSTLFAKESAEALQLIDQAIKRGVEPHELDYLKMAKALSLVELRKPKDAQKILRELEKSAEASDMRVEAAYRLGDVDFEFKKYSEAATEYERALGKYPDYAKVFPNALFDLAESQFWLGKYNPALKNYVEFLKTYPRHDHGGYAMTRVGEVLDILGANQSQVMSAYLESFFKYPNNQGSEVARLRMLSQGLKSMKDKQKNISLDEIEEIRKRSTLPRIDEFVTLMVSEGLSKREEYDDSLDKLMTYFQTNPTTANLKVFKGRILRNISDILKKDVTSNNFMDALNFYGQYSGTWLKNSDRIDVEFFKAKAFEQAGVYSEANTIYKVLAKKREKIQGTKEEKERLVYEYLPTLNSIKLRLAAVAFEEKRYRQAYDEIKSIKTELSTSEEIEKAKIGAGVASEVGDNKMAIQFLEDLVKKWSNQPDLLASPYYELGKLYLKTNKLPQVESAISFVEELRKKDESLVEQVWAQTLDLKAEYLLKKGNRLAAVETYVAMLDQYDSKRPMASTRYKAGLILFEEGDVKGAEQIWSPLSTGSESFYKRLAQEKLEQMEWQESYKKYIDRIPAAKDLK